MYCSKCNAELLDGAKFCAVCGTKVQEAPVVVEAASASAASVIPQVIPVSVDPGIGLLSEPVTQTVYDVENETEELVNKPVAEQAIPVSSAPFAEKPVSGPVKKEKKPMKLVLIALAIVAVIAIVAVVVVMAMSGVFSPKKPSPKPYLLVRGEEESLIYYGSEDPTEIKGELANYRYSSDGKIMAMTIDVDDENLGDLILCTGKDTIEVADEVYGFTLSDNGQKLAYYTDYDDKKQTAKLNVFDLSSRKSTEIAEDILAEAGVVFSPDGKTIGYIGDLKMKDDKLDSFMGFVSKNGEKSVEIGKNRLIMAVADNAAYVYSAEVNRDATDGEGDLYVKKGEKEEKLGKANMSAPIYFNQNCSEILFTRSGSTYISVDGADKEKIAGDVLDSIVFPQNTSISYSFFEAYAIVASVPTLKDQIILLDEDGDVSVSYLNSKLEVEEIDSLEGDSYLHDVSVSADGKSLVFIDDSGAAQIYRNFRNLNEKPVEMDPGKDLISILPSKDFSKFYLLDEDNTLYLQTSGGEPIDVFEDVDENSMTFSPDERRLYFTADSKTDDKSYLSSANFYAVDSKAGAKPEEIADEVTYFRVSEYGVLYYVYDKTDDSVNYFDAYFSRDGEKFKSVMDEAL